MGFWGQRSGGHGWPEDSHISVILCPWASPFCSRSQDLHVCDEGVSLGLLFSRCAHQSSSGLLKSSKGGGWGPGSPCFQPEQLVLLWSVLSTDVPCKLFEKRDLVLLKCGLAHPQALPPPTFMVPWLSHPRLGVGTKDHCLPIWGHEGLVLFVDAVINLVLDWETVIGVFLFFNILLKYRWFAMLC